MKKFTLFLLAFVAMMVAMPAVAQDRNNEDEVVKIDSRRRDYREGEVLVKFKPTSRVNVRAKNGKFQSSAVSAVDAVLEVLGVDSVDQLMPLSGNKVSQRRMRTANGAELVDTDMSKLYRMKFSREKIQSVRKVIETLKALPEVEYVEPNYIVYALSLDEYTDSATCVAEPLYSEQYGLSVINVPYLWNKPRIKEKRPVIAILDTGVDTEHPDLQANIWTNEVERKGLEEEDDDNNGFVDDIHGWDFVNQTFNMRDFNGHGTHCAGIAAAVGNNGIGITGANPDALIMPISVIQSDGTGDVATIIKGIDYAIANGADVLNMSFGSYQYSIAEEQALVKAYAKMVLVAAAGNDFLSVNSRDCSINGEPAVKNKPMFPAAFAFVLGVTASDESGNLAGFSNFDCDGPMYSTYAEDQLYNYELRAPGVGIMSTYPGGRYKTFNGTSMSCSFVAGAISALLDRKEYASKEVLFSDLIYSRKLNGYKDVDFKTVYDITDTDSKPELVLVSYIMVDSIGGDGDGRPDAGDTILFYPVLKNMWGQAENIKMTLEVGENEDPEIVTILDSEVEFGCSLGAYAKKSSTNPIRIVVNPKCVDGRDIKLLLKVTCDNISRVLEHNFVIIAENVVEIGGLIMTDRTLYPNNHYIVTSSLVVAENVTLTIKPGTILKFKDETGLSVAPNGHLIAQGTPDSMIVFTKTDFGNGNFRGLFLNEEDTLKYVIVEHLWSDLETNILSGCIFENSIIRYNTATDGVNPLNINSCTFVNSNYYCNIAGAGQDNKAINTNECNNISIVDPSCGYFTLIGLGSYNNSYVKYLEQSNVLNNTWKIGEDRLLLSCYSNSSMPVDYEMTVPSYFGSAREDIVRKGVWDVESGSGFGYFNLSNMLTRPSSEAHGIVWKVVVNGYDAQDEFELLPPLGVGRHKFEVYFNRAMDTAVVPTISMGLRPPYTQVTIARNGSWSADSTIYTAYLDITGKTATDGLNRIYVYGAKDTDHFEIPEENMRFNVQVASAGSMGTGLMAEAGLGRVKLTWVIDEENFEDLLGYNIYRFTFDSNGVSSDSIVVNQSLIDAGDTEFVDYAVVPRETYYYIIKQVTTSLSSYSLSNPVAATPLTAMKGDVNGSMKVDVADVVAIVGWLTNQNPKPFILEAADVNEDGIINVLDVVAVLNSIINPSYVGVMEANNTAIYSIENGILYVETPVALGGVQFLFGVDEDAEIKPLASLDGFEKVSGWRGEDEYMFIAYSLSGKTIPIGRHALLEIGDAELSDIVLSDTHGHNVLPINSTTSNLGVVEQMQLSSPYPNPFREQIVVPYLIGQAGEYEVRMVFSDVTGRTIDVYTTTNSFGSYSYTWIPAQDLLMGVYFVSLYVDDKLMQTSKIVYIQ